MLVSVEQQDFFTTNIHSPELLAFAPFRGCPHPTRFSSIAFMLPQFKNDSSASTCWKLKENKNRASPAGICLAIGDLRSDKTEASLRPSLISINTILMPDRLRKNILDANSLGT